MIKSINVFTKINLCLLILILGNVFGESRFTPRNHNSNRRGDLHHVDHHLDHHNGIDAPFKRIIKGNRKRKIGAGAGSAGIYGIGGAEYVDGAESLVYYDASTGEATTLVVGDTSYLTGQGLGCLDNVNNIYYFLYEMEDRETLETGLYGYNLEDPTSTIDPIPLPMVFSDDFVGAGDACLGDPNTGDMYVLCCVVLLFCPYLISCLYLLVYCIVLFLLLLVLLFLSLFCVFGAFCVFYTFA